MPRKDKKKDRPIFNEQLISDVEKLQQKVAAIAQMLAGLLSPPATTVAAEEDQCAVQREARDAAFIVRNTLNAASASLTEAADAGEIAAQTGESNYQAAEQVLLDCESQ